jgi:hypothetical protein
LAKEPLVGSTASADRQKSETQVLGIADASDWRAQRSRSRSAANLVFNSSDNEVGFAATEKRGGARDLAALRLIPERRAHCSVGSSMEAR